MNGRTLFPGHTQKMHKITVPGLWATLSGTWPQRVLNDQLRPESKTLHKYIYFFRDLDLYCELVR